MPTHAKNTPALIVLRNARGDSVQILSLGGVLRAWNIAVDSGPAVNIVLGYPEVESYQLDSAFHGAIAGRYCNRIANSQFALDGHTQTLASNEGPHHLHGGPEGFSRRAWQVGPQTAQTLQLSLRSPSGDQGYPGELNVTVTYTLDDDGALDIDWAAISSADTIVSLTSHAYYNLTGSGNILNHWLRIPAEHYTPVDNQLIPTGEIRNVVGSDFDLRSFTRLQDVVQSASPEIRACAGLDHNWAFGDTDALQLRAELLCPDSDLLLTCSSTLPGLQCYTGNGLQADGVHGNHAGICLEPQYYPDSPNQPHFPSPVLRAGDVMRHRIRYQVSHVDARARLA